MGGDGLCRRQEKEAGQEGEEEAGGQHRARALQLQGELNRHTSVTVELKERKGKELSEVLTLLLLFFILIRSTRLGKSH